MSTDDQTAEAPAGISLGGRAAAGPRELAKRLVWRLLPAYGRHRSQEAASATAIAGLRAEFDHSRERQVEQIERLEELARELILTAESLRRGVRDADATASSARRMIEPIVAELNALPYVDGAPFESFAAPVGEVVGFRNARTMLGDAEGYVAFERLFRGPAERVAASQQPYLRLVAEHQPVLDVGCGRGEFLALLRDEGIEARGVDSDEGMVSACRAEGLAADVGDVNAYLEGVADESLGTVFSAQLIEHLPQAELMRMLELSARKLRPGGLYIAETVNPHRISSLKTFWVDLTHQHPIFPEVALVACAIAGFESAYVFAPTFESFERARFESPAYAVVATRGQAG